MCSTTTCLPVNSTSIQLRLPLDFNICINPDSKSIVNTVCAACEEAGLFRYIHNPNRDMYGYSSQKMLECVLLAYTLFGYASVRQLEDYCKHDIRFIYLMQGDQPSFMSFQRFISDDLTESIEDIFYSLNRYIEQRDTELDTDVMTIDGTKYEANANKMTFVWMKATKKNKSKLWGQIMKEISQINHCLKDLGKTTVFSVLHTMNVAYINSICENLKQIAQEKEIEFVYGKGKRKTELQRHYDTMNDYALRMWKYEMHEDIAQGRNSFSKTDCDATMMHMKYDYYNHTNVFKPGYNVQMGISDGYVRNIYISSDANDLNTYIPFMDRYYTAYGKYPKKTPADAGYGSFDNYTYCKMHGIELWLKYAGQEREKKKTSKDRFKVWAFDKDEEGNLICPQGYPFQTVSVRIERRGKYPRISETQKTGRCEDCPLRSQCTKSKNGRTVNRVRELDKFKAEVKENMSTDEGKKLMILRDIQSEGTFGNIKANWKYDRLQRRGESGVNLEILLVCIGVNFRRYHHRMFESDKDKQTAKA